jgi:aminomethyltransferase
MKQTPLHEQHLKLGARMAPFAGFDMPIQYTGIIHEHQATRTSAAVFDTCHMGEFQLRGSSVLTDLERIVTCRLSDLPPGHCRYGLMCNVEGGVVDDLLVYRLADNEFMLVVNAGTRAKDYQWLCSHLSSASEIRDCSDETAKIDLQGPDAPRIAQILLDAPIDGMVFYSFARNAINGEPVLVSRTGYTGEVGFEFYGTAPIIIGAWQRCLELGAWPAGLGARDTLRLEMGMPLYGHEWCESRNASESGFTHAFALDKEFIGADAVRRTPASRLCGIRVSGRRAVRAGDEVLLDGRKVGEVTSGSFAPSLQVPVALAYVRADVAGEGTPLTLRHHDRQFDGTVVPLPFYTSGTARKRLSRFL